VSDYIYTEDQQDRIRDAFLEIYIKAYEEKRNLIGKRVPPKAPDLDKQLEDFVYPLGDSPRSVKAFLRQDGLVRNYYRDYAALKPMSDSVQSLILSNIFHVSQLQSVKVTIKTTKEGEQLLAKEGLGTSYKAYRTVSGTPYDSLRKSYKMENPLALEDLKTLDRKIKDFAKDVSTRGYTKEWKAIADSIKDLELEVKGKYGNTTFGMDIKMMKDAWRYNKWAFARRTLYYFLLPPLLAIYFISLLFNFS
tara:strand:+ start:145 stop:891 length:747 start_codon:yes stop_codon:yes gene_type:complete